MTESENKNIITLLHEMEVRFTERLTRIEAEASAWRKTHEDMRMDIDRVAQDAKEAVATVASAQESDSIRLQRLTIGLVIVAIMAAGRLGISIFQMLV